jgi:hypothetical protein
MSGSAGLSPSGNPKPEGSTLSGYARNLKKECAGLVAGQAVLTAEIRTVDFYSRSSFPHCQRSSCRAPQKTSSFSAFRLLLTPLLSLIDIRDADAMKVRYN